MWQRYEFVALALEELVLKLNPVKTQAVKEAFQNIHKHQNEHSNGSENHEWYDYCDDWVRL